MKDFNDQAVTKDKKDNKKIIINLARLLGGVLLFFTFVFGVVYVYSSISSRYSKLKYIVVKGNNILPLNVVKNLVLRSGYSSLTSYEVSRIYFNLISNPWIDTARVTKIFPDTIFVVIKEKKPVALVYWKKKVYLVDRNCDVIDTLKKYLRLSKSLPRIVLKSDLLNDKLLLRAVKTMYEKLDKIGKINYIEVVSDSYQVVYFSDGLKVVINSLDCPQVAIRRLAYKWTYLLSLRKKLDSVSICFNNKFVLKWKKGVER